LRRRRTKDTASKKSGSMGHREGRVADTSSSLTKGTSEDERGRFLNSIRNTVSKREAANLGYGKGVLKRKLNPSQTMTHAFVEPGR